MYSEKVEFFKETQILAKNGKIDVNICHFFIRIK